MMKDKECSKPDTKTEEGDNNMKQEIPRELIDDRLKKLADKGTDMADVDLYNLCFLNKLREADNTNNKSIQLTSETPIIDKLKREVDILRMLLDDPHPREKTWISAYYGQVDKLMEFWSGSSSQQAIQADAEMPCNRCIDKKFSLQVRYCSLCGLKLRTA